MKSPTVSIIISAYNGIKYLPATVNSILQQTFSDFEVLIVNHGRFDNIVEWFNRLRDRRFKLISQGNLGVSKTLNLGIIEARGEYVAFLDAEDLWHPSKLQKQVFCFDHYPGIGLVHSWMMLIDNWGNPTGRILQNNLSGWVEPKILERNQIGSSSVMVRRRCFDSVGLFAPQLQTTQDWDMWIRMSRCYQFMAIAEPLVYYRQNQDSIRKNWLLMETNFQTTIEKAYADAPEELSYLKHRSYAHISLDLAWKVLQSQEPDPVIAHNYCRQALEHYPYIGFSPEFLQVSLAVLTLNCLKSDRYNQLLLLIQAIQLWLRAISDKFQIYTQGLLTWMLEEEDNISFWQHRKIEQQGKD